MNDDKQPPAQPENRNPKRNRLAERRAAKAAGKLARRETYKVAKARARDPLTVRSHAFTAEEARREREGFPRRPRADEPPEPAELEPTAYLIQREDLEQLIQEAKAFLEETGARLLERDSEDANKRIALVMHEIKALADRIGSLETKIDALPPKG